MKLNKLLALTLVAATSVVFAVDDMQVRNLENRVNALEQRRGSNGMINPPARPVVKDGCDFWFQGEALYMHATEDGVNYGIKLENDSSFIDGRVKNISYDWSWGWRAGVGYNLPHDGWDMMFNYTWFRSGESNSSNTDAPESVLQTWTNPANATLASAHVAHARGTTSLKFDYLDFQLGREFFVSKWLTLRPYVGGRALWAHRNMTVKYRGGELGTGNLITVQKLKERFNNRFRGGGLLTGLDTQWGLGEGWSLYGQFALSLIYGQQRLHEKQDVYSPSGTKTRIAHIHDAWSIVRTMTDLGLGLRWDRLFSNDAYRIRLQLGWEQHVLNGFDKDINFVDSTVQGKFTLNQGDFALSGFTFQVRFDF